MKDHSLELLQSKSKEELVLLADGAMAMLSMAHIMCKEMGVNLLQSIQETTELNGIKKSKKAAHDAVWNHIDDINERLNAELEEAARNRTHLSGDN